MALTFTTTPNAQPASDARRAEILANPGFGQSFTDHMLQATWTPEQGWHDGSRPIGTRTDPCGASGRRRMPPASSAPAAASRCQR